MGIENKNKGNQSKKIEEQPSTTEAVKQEAAVTKKQ